jgi:hypothetical protein
MTPIAEEALKKEEDEEEHLSDKKDYWENELKSLGIEPRRQNDLNDKAELEALAELSRQFITKIIKQHMVIVVIIIIRITIIIKNKKCQTF